MRALRNTIVAALACRAVLAALRRRDARPHRTPIHRSDRRPFRHAIALLLAAGAAAAAIGILVLLSGVVANRASDPHWPFTAWLLELATRQSVATHSLGIRAPPLDDPALVLRGAGHFETGCSPCHGNPDNRNPPIAGQMMPEPPYLPDVVGSWTPPQLFTIVKHGIKFAGMPAWPASERDDEVWAVVAFLLELPRLDGGGYRALVHGDTSNDHGSAELAGLVMQLEGAGAALTRCARCHGIFGEGRGNAAFPRLAGQHAPYLLRSLEAYASGARPSGIMQPVAAALRPEQMRALAQYFSALPPAPALPPSDPEAVAVGESIARDGVPAARVPACSDCHGPFPHDAPIDPHYPRLAGQWADYLEQQLRLFREGIRGGTAYREIMAHVGLRLDDEQIRAVAAYYAALSP